MRKRIFCLVLALVFLMSLCGCGTSSGGGDPQDGSASIEDEQDAQTGDSGNPSGIRTLAYSIKKDYQNQWDDHYNMQTIDCVYDQILLGDEDRKALNGLNSALSDYNKQISQESEEEFLRLHKQFEEFLEENERPDVMYTLSNELKMIRADETVASILRITDEYAGGPHPYQTFSSVLFDSQTGKKLKLSDVITDVDRFEDRIADQLISEYPDLGEEEIMSGLTEEMNWVLGYQGIDVYYAAGTLAAYAAGPLHTQVLFTEEPDLFQEKYRTVPNGYTIPMVDGQPLYYDLEGKGEANEIIASGDGYQEGYYENILVTSGKDSTRSEAWAFTIDPVFLHTADGRNYVYAEATSDNDYRILFVYEVKKDHVKEIGKVEGTGFYNGKDYMSCHMITDPSDFILETRLDALSTYSGIRHCHVAKDGMPVSEQSFYEIENGFELTLKKDMEFTMLDEKGQEKEPTVVPKGSKLTFLRTDGRKWVDFSVKNADASYEVRVYYDDSDWPTKVNNEDAEALFDGMMYAG